jgi:hypothetical protein
VNFDKVSHLFVSLFGDPASKTNLAIRANVGKIAALRPRVYTPLKLDFYDAASAKV